MKEPRYTAVGDAESLLGICSWCGAVVTTSSTPDHTAWHLNGPPQPKPPKA